MALLDLFQEIHLCLSMHYCPNGAFPSALSIYRELFDHLDK